MEVPLIHLIALLAVFGFGLLLVLRAGKRSAQDVIRDLQSGQYGGSDKARELQKQVALVLNDELAALGLYENSARQSFRLKQKLLPLVGAAVMLIGRLIISPTNNVVLLVVMTITGAALGYLYAESRKRAIQVSFTQQLEFYLPIVMERLVMAVSAGLDVIAAIRSVLELERDHAALEARALGLPNADQAIDPVTRLVEIVYRLTESGLGFEQSLREVAAMVPCAALRHAFIHLALAHREGGELVMPLRELSDATQSYYQESVEEEIAKMPVKATMPLLCTFAGLVIFFLTSPMIQVISMTQKAMPQ